MSHYRKLQTTYTSRVFLREALQAAGIPFEEARPGQTLTVNGYAGQHHEAVFAVRRRDIGASYGDFGWAWDGMRFVQIEDDLDANRARVQQHLHSIKREYAYAATVAAARIKGYQTRRIDHGSGAIQVVVTGRI